MRRASLISFSTLLVVGLAAGRALACGGLVSPNGTIELVRTTTMAAYLDGVEHYVTGFEFVGAGAEFGSIIPLPGVPEKVIKGGDWTLQRLEQEVQPPVPSPAETVVAAELAEGGARVIIDKNIDALRVRVVTGGGDAVGQWAGEQGFVLPPDAPEVLDFYASRSPVFMAVQFDPERAERRGRNIGDAIPVHLVIPTKRPWVPLRILGLGTTGPESIEADVFLLTEDAPNLLPVPQGGRGFGPAASGLTLLRSEEASSDLLRDLRSDRGMKWLPARGMWLSFLELRATSRDLVYDLAIDPTGTTTPSPVDAGLVEPGARAVPRSNLTWALWLGAALLGAMVLIAVAERRGQGARPAV
jgi:hypothetical protein